MKKIYDEIFPNETHFLISISTEDNASAEDMSQLVDDAVSYFIQDGIYRDGEFNKVDFTFKITTTEKLLEYFQQIKAQTDDVESLLAKTDEAGKVACERLLAIRDNIEKALNFIVNGNEESN